VNWPFTLPEAGSLDYRGVCLERLIHIRLLVTEPIWVTAFIGGEFAYCLGSALDQLAWQLVLTNTKQRLVRNTSFPIHEKYGGSFAKAVEGMPENAIEVIESLQPYMAGDK
jgi:hypothetical protein